MPLLSNFALRFAVRKVQINQNGLKINGTHQILVYADAVNILGGSVHIIKKNTEALVVASKENGIEGTWSCFEIRMQDEVKIWRFITVPLKGQNSSNIWEQP